MNAWYGPLPAIIGACARRQAEGLEIETVAPGARYFIEEVRPPEAHCEGCPLPAPGRIRPPSGETGDALTIIHLTPIGNTVYSS